MDPGRENCSSINFLARGVKRPCLPSRPICFGTLPASSSPLQPHQYLYQILVETLERKNISSSESFNVSPRVLLEFLKRGGLENVFPISSRLSLFSLSSLVPQGGSDPWRLQGERGLEQGQACQRERGCAALSSHIPAALIHLTWKRNRSSRD